VQDSGAVPEPVNGEGVAQVKPKGVDVDTVKLTRPENPFREAMVIVVGQLVLIVHGTVVAPDGAIVKSGVGTVTVMVAF
jgi:hypothetical protein